MNRIIDHKYFLFFVILTAIVLRLINLNQSLWLDETIGALVVRERGFWDILVNFSKGDNHPPLYYLALDIWSNIFGYKEIALRSLSLLFSIGSIWFTYLITKFMFEKENKYLAKITAVLLAVSPFHIYYSQEARMYMMASFVAVVLIYSYLKITSKTTVQNTRLWWIVYSLSTVAIIFTDYMPVFLIPVFFIHALCKRMGIKWWREFISAYIPSVLMGILWLPNFIVQLRGGRWLIETLPEWQKLSGGATLKQATLVWIKFTIGRISFNDKIFYYSLIVLVSLPLLFLFIKAIKRYKEILLIWLWLVVPLLAGFLTSVIFPAFIYFRYVYVYPAFCIIVAYSITSISKKTLRNVMLILVFLINISFTLVYYFDRNQQRENWKGAIAFVEDNAKENEIMLFTNTEPFAPVRYYSKGKVKSFGATDSINADALKTKLKTSDIVSGVTGIYYFEYLNDLHDPDGYVKNTIESLKYTKIRVDPGFIGVGGITYYVLNL